MDVKPINVSVVLEWENVLLAEDSRCFLMLRRLREQLDDVHGRVELIVLFNPEQVGGEAIESALKANLDFDRSGSNAELILEEAKGKHYYELKNQGAARARGEVVVYIDSDVVPEDHWLKEISRYFFERPDVAVVAGHTYISCESLPQKAFALGWFFPLRVSVDEFSQNKPKFYANNVAFRRDIIRKHPFPDMPTGVTRGACTRLARDLDAAGVRIWTNTAARVHHPPPSDLGHYFTRAFAHGRDNVVRWSNAGNASGRMIRRSLEWSAKRIARSARRTIHQHRRVDLPAWQIPAAFGIMLSFYCLALFGSIITVCAPEYAKRRWQI